MTILIMLIAMAVIFALIFASSFSMTKGITIALKICTIIAIGSMVTFILSGISTETYEEKESEIEIISLADNSYVSGHGSRYYVTINSTGGYTFYYKVADGGIVQATIDTSKTVVYQNKECQKPLVITYKTYNKPFFPISEDLQMFWFGRSNNPTSVRYEIYVPEGTIVYEFNLDSNL